jgi:hypothetical protein
MTAMTFHRMAQIGAVTAILVLLASACGDVSDSSPNTANTTLPAATTSTTAGTTTTVESDQAKAMAELLTLSDLPAGWTSSPSDNSSDSSGFGGQDGSAQMASCLGVSAALLDANPPEADSPTFSSADQADTVDDQAEVFPTTAAAKTDFSLFSSAKTPRCMSQLLNGPLKSEFTQQLDAGQTFVSFSAAAESVPHLGDQSGGLRMTFVIAQSGIDVKVFIDLVLVIKGRSETTITVTQPQVLAVPQLGIQMATIAAGRMTA